MEQGSNLSQNSLLYGGAVAAIQVVLAGVAWSQIEAASGLVHAVLGGIVLVALGGWLAQVYYLRSTLFQPLSEVVIAIKGLGNGEFSHIVPRDQSGEMAELCQGVVKLNGFLAHLKEQLDSAADKLHSSSKQLSSGTRNMGDRVQETHSMADQIAAAMDEMTVTAREVSGHASRAADQTHAMNEAVTTGQKSMKEATNAIDRLSNQMDLAVNTVRKLAEDSSSVGKVLSVIRGIAEQTNLLALNAAIEAARAGEQGRGFAVVADEVRSLAQKTQESTQEIQVIIENVQNGAKNATSVIDSSKAITTETSGLFSEAGSQLTEISNSIGELNSLNTHVARAVDEQTRAADSIGRDVTRIAQIAEDFKSLQSDVEETSQELSSLSESNSRLCQRFGSSN